MRSPAVVGVRGKRDTVVPGLRSQKRPSHLNPANRLKRGQKKNRLRGPGVLRPGCRRASPAAARISRLFPQPTSEQARRHRVQRADTQGHSNPASTQTRPKMLKQLALLFSLMGARATSQFTASNSVWLSPDPEPGKHSAQVNFHGYTIESGDRLVRSSAGIGDLDLDGIPDITVCASHDSDGGVTKSGAVYILYMNDDLTVREAQKIANDAGGFCTQAEGSPCMSCRARQARLLARCLGRRAPGLRRRRPGGRSRSDVFFRKPDLAPTCNTTPDHA